MLRLSDEAETAVNLADPDSIGGSGASGGCLMIAGYEGTADAVAARRAAVTAVLAGLGGTDLGEEPGRAWAAGRFGAPYLRDSLLDDGVLVETLETATFWSRLEPLYAAVTEALQGALDGALVLCHVSHVYETGASLYFTVAAQAGRRPARAVAGRQGRRLRRDRRGGRHDHPPPRGRHRPRAVVAEEIGPVGVLALRAVKDALDPAGILNPGVLLP